MIKRVAVLAWICVLFPAICAAKLSGPTRLSFGSQLVNSSSQQTLTFYNSGNRSLKIKNVALTTSTVFSLSGWNGPIVLQPSQAMNLYVTFIPLAQTSYTGSLTIYTSVSDLAVILSGSGVNPTPSPGTAISVSISPTGATVVTGQAQQFTATVTGTTDQTVNWYVSGVQGGDATVGTISSNGLYTAPSCAPSSSVVITVQSVYDSTRNATADVSVVASTSSSLDRYVSTTGNDSNDGSACRPWATIQQGANSAQAGMTIHVGPGTYNNSAIIVSTANGTASSRIRFISDQQWGAKIVSSASQIWSNSGTYVDIMGFDMSGSATTYIGIHSMGSYERSIGNRVHDMGSSGCNSGAGIMMGGGALYQSALANFIYNVGPAPAVPGCNQIHGIYAQESYCVIQNNLTFHNAAIGIQLWGRPSYCIVTNNTSFGNRDGMVLGMDGSEGTTPVDYNVIANNILYNNLEYGFYQQDSGNIAYIGTHNQYLNNLINSNCSGIPDNCNDPGTGIYMVVGAMVNTVNGSPQFVNYTGDAIGDYHLSFTSPAVDAGTSTDAPETDFSGGARPQGSAWDIGAYEYGAVPAVWPWM